MNQAKIIFQDIYCKPVSKDHINKGWLSWMNNPKTTKQINKEGKKFTETDLENYLKQKKSIFFLACYSKEGKYFGNLRIHEWTPNIACFGRLIGSEEHRGKGYGKVLVELAKSLIFENKKYNIIIAGNNKGDLASSNSKLRSSFIKMDQKSKNALNLEFNNNHEYFVLHRSHYYQNFKRSYKT
jgi:hypothetical protein